MAGSSTLRTLSSGVGCGSRWEPWIKPNEPRFAIAGFPLRATDRQLRILALKLYCLFVRHRKPSRRVDPNIARFYKQLWPVSSGTPSGERTDRLEIDEALAGSDLLRP